MGKHTPGPWKTNTKGVCIVTDNTGSRMAWMAAAPGMLETLNDVLRLTKRKIQPEDKDLQGWHHVGENRLEVIANKVKAIIAKARRV